MAAGPYDADGFALVGTAAEIREMDRQTIARDLVPGRVLMELAGAGAARLIRERCGGRAGKATVLCGGGNNGGDGYVIARHLTDAGWAVRCIATRSGDRLTGDARINHDLWAALGGVTRAADKGATAAMRNWIGHADVVVDALFGTGLSRPIEGPAAELIAMANAAKHGLRVACDIPSGVDATTGRALGVPFRAALTPTFAAAKTGLYCGVGPENAGEVAVVEIGIPRQVIDSVGTSARLASPGAVAALLPRREASSHKGTHGHVGVLGGFDGKDGAARLAAIASLRAGAGLATWARHGAPPAREPEVMFCDLASGLPERVTVWVAGPGLGGDAAAAAALDGVLAFALPTVLDADALNLLATSHGADRARGTIVTPHPREAARLLDTSVADVQSDRFGAARALVSSTGATVVLKGARTIVAGPEMPAYVFDAPTPALAAGGTGDVLAGIIGAFLAQGLAPRAAALCAVQVHIDAARRLADPQGQRGVLASEIANAVPDAIGQLLGGWAT